MLTGSSGIVVLALLSLLAAGTPVFAAGTASFGAAAAFAVLLIAALDLRGIEGLVKMLHGEVDAALVVVDRVAVAAAEADGDALGGAGLLDGGVEGAGDLGGQLGRVAVLGFAEF